MSRENKPVYMAGALGGVVVYTLVDGSLSTLYDQGAAFLFALCGAFTAFLVMEFYRESMEVAPPPAFSLPYIGVEEDDEE